MPTASLTTGLPALHTTTRQVLATLSGVDCSSWKRRLCPISPRCTPCGFFGLMDQCGRVEDCTYGDQTDVEVDACKRAITAALGSRIAGFRRTDEPTRASFSYRVATLGSEYVTFEALLPVRSD